MLTEDKTLRAFLATTAYQFDKEKGHQLYVNPEQSLFYQTLDHEKIQLLLNKYFGQVDLRLATVDILTVQQQAQLLEDQKKEEKRDFLQRHPIVTSLCQELDATILFIKPTAE
jgi:hypothetical protein